MQITDVSYHNRLLDHLQRAVAFALEEDIEDGDITAQLVPEAQTVKAQIVAKEAGVLCGQAWVNEVFAQLDPSVSLKWKLVDGDTFTAGTVLLEMAGNARSILTAERSALNFLQMLSGTATLSHHYAQAVDGKNIDLLDTRKTIPGMRLAQKYAVKVGGCGNHRLGLYDMFLIKENHIAAAGGIEAAVAACEAIAPEASIEVEVENLDEFNAANALPRVNYIMLDELSETDTQTALDTLSDYHQIEISGGVDLTRLQDVKPFSQRVRISSGLLTKAIQPIDLSLRIVG